MDRDESRILSMIKEGQRILATEEKVKQEKIDAERYQLQQKWRGLYRQAKVALPVEIAKYLVAPVGVTDGNEYFPGSVANYYQWQIKIKSMVPIEVHFGDDGLPNQFTVPLAEPVFVGMSKETDRSFTGDHALERALAFAVEQTIALGKIEAERERLHKEYEEREAMAAKEPTYEPVDGLEGLPWQVLVESLRRLMQEELKKAGVLS